MKMTAIFNGLKVANENYYDAKKDDDLHLWDGSRICFDCYENNGPNDCYNYADWSALEGTGFFEDKSIRADTLYLEACEYGFRINGYFVPCYSSQNGYYTDQITIIAYDEYGNELQRLDTNCEE